ncbi:MAG: serine protein kinase RIO [Candidatus Brockarchaeota archaeon]|nr:serine protein kinase RIO [Candidatus Brockarchaeota archaeon]
MRREKVFNTLELREKIIEKLQRMKVKRSEDFEVLSEVFNVEVLMQLYDMLRKGFLKEFNGEISSGKESKVFHAIAKGNVEVAVKIYLIVNTEIRRMMLKYIIGDKRFERVKSDSRSLVYTWARKEYANLSTMHEAGLPVPKPILVQKNILVMSFIGENGQRAPLLKELHELKNPRETYMEIINFIVKSRDKARLIHADLSEYNVMIWDGKPFIIDLSQAVPVTHPLAGEFLRRDVENINRFFMKRGWVSETIPVEEVVGDWLTYSS